MAANVRLQHISYPKRGYDLLGNVSNLRTRTSPLHLPITHSNSSSLPSSYRQSKKLKVSFEVLDIPTPFVAPVPQHDDKSLRRKRRRLAPKHESKRPIGLNAHSLLPPSPPFEPDNQHVVLLRKFDEEYHHSPLLTPKDDDDENYNENESEHEIESDSKGSRTKFYFSADEATPDSEKDDSKPSILKTNADYIALQASLRSLNGARTKINGDIAMLDSLLLFHAKNTDKAVAVDFFMKLMQGKLSLPRPTKIPSVPLVEWGKYHPYFAQTSIDFDEVTAFLSGPINLAVHIFDQARFK